MADEEIIKEAVKRFGYTKLRKLEKKGKVQMSIVQQGIKMLRKSKKQ